MLLFNVVRNLHLRVSLDGYTWPVLIIG